MPAEAWSAWPAMKSAMSLVSMLPSGTLGTTYPDMPWEPKRVHRSRSSMLSGGLHRSRFQQQDDGDRQARDEHLQDDDRRRLPRRPGQPPGREEHDGEGRGGHQELE